MKTRRHEWIFKTWWKPLLFMGMAVVIIFAPYGFGYVVQSVAEKNIRLFAERNPHIQLISYQRGVFHSMAVLAIKNQNDAVNIEIDILHGPYLFLYHNSITDKPYFGWAKASYRVIAATDTQKKLAKYLG